MNQNSIITKISAICQKSPCDRTKSELELLIDLTKHWKVFENTIHINNQEIQKYCCKYFQYLCVEQDSHIFQKGESVRRAFFVIQGKLIIETPEGSFELTEKCGFGGFEEKNRMADVRSVDKSHFLYLEKADLKAAVEEFKERKKNSNINFLHSLPGFISWDRRALTRLEKAFHERHINQGQFVYHEGDPATELFFIKKGTFELHKLIKTQEKPLSLSKNFSLTNKAKTTRKKCVIALYGPGQIFGEEDALQSELRSNTCKCVESDSVLLVISKENFIKETSYSTEYVHYIASKVANKVQDLENRTKMRKFVETLPKRVSSNEGKTRIIKDLEKDMKQKCSVFCSSSSFSMRTLKSKAEDSESTHRNLFPQPKNEKNIPVILKKPILHNQSEQMLLKLVKYSKFIQGRTLRKNFQRVESLTISAFDKSDSSSSPIKHTRTQTTLFQTQSNLKSI